MISRRSWWLVLLVLSMAAILAASLAVMAGVGYQNLGSIDLLKEQFSSGHSRFGAVDVAGASENLIEWFQRGSELFPGYPRLGRSLALSLWAGNDLEAARERMMTYGNAVPEDKTAQFFLGDMLYASGEVNGALDYWSRLPAGMVLVARAQEALDDRKLESAETLLQMASEAGPASYGLSYRIAEQYEQLGRIYRETGDIERLDPVCDRGSAAFRTAADFEPSQYFVRIQHGALLRLCGRPEDAVKQFLTAAESPSPETKAWAQHEVGVTYLGNGELERALPYFERAVQLDSQNGIYRISLGRAYARFGLEAEARAQFTAALTSGDEAWRAAASEELRKLEQR